MSTYLDKDYARIGAVIGKTAADFSLHTARFEKAAEWYRISQQPKRRVAPSTLTRKLDQIAASARRLLPNLNIQHAREASDGPEIKRSSMRWFPTGPDAGNGSNNRERSLHRRLHPRSQRHREGERTVAMQQAPVTGWRGPRRCYRHASITTPEGRSAVQFPANASRHRRVSVPEVRPGSRDRRVRRS